jgi:iron complex transport system permease protein
VNGAAQLDYAEAPQPVSRLAAWGAWLRRPAGGRAALLVLAALLLLAALAATRIGAVQMSTAQVVSALLGVRIGAPLEAQQIATLWSIRLPRVILAVLVGATLGTSGAAMQGLFRNPLADPALLGISNGAALGAAAMIVLGASLPGLVPPSARLFLVPAAAFAAALLATTVSVRIGRIHGRTSTALMLLAGVAVNALAGAGIGWLMHLANDAQLRTLTFWTLGSLGGASWRTLGVVTPCLLATILLLPRASRALNALLLGEAEASHLGFSVEKIKRATVILTALGVGAAVSISGGIGFVGLLVPHVVRLLLGPDHRRLLPASALLGATLLTAADIVARTVVVPAELPVGVITAAVGAPLFLWQLARLRSNQVLA